MKKIILTESEKKAILIAREKAIVESFAKTFNKIKRIDENEVAGIETKELEKKAFDFAKSPEMGQLVDKILANAKPEDLQQIKRAVGSVSEGMMSENDFSSFLNIAHKAQSALSEDNSVGSLQNSVGKALSTFGVLNIMSMGALPSLVGMAVDHFGGTNFLQMAGDAIGSGTAAGVLSVIGGLIGGGLLWRLGKAISGEKVTGDTPLYEMGMNDGEAYGMSFEDAKAEAKRISDEEGGVAQHVNQVGEDKFIVSDFFDADTTVASFGMGIDEIKRIDEVSTSLARKAYYGAEKASLDTNQPFDAQRKQNQSDTFRRYINPDIKAMAKKLNIGLDRANTGNAIICYLGSGAELRDSFESAGVVVRIKPDEIMIEKGDIRSLPTAYMNSVNRFVKKVQADLTGNSEGQVDENFNNPKEQKIFNIFSKYIKDPNKIDWAMDIYFSRGYEGLPETLKAGLRDDMDFITLTQQDHDEETFRSETGGSGEENLNELSPELKQRAMNKAFDKTWHAGELEKTKYADQGEAFSSHISNPQIKVLFQKLAATLKPNTGVYIQKTTVNNPKMLVRFEHPDGDFEVQITNDSYKLSDESIVKELNRAQLQLFIKAIKLAQTEIPSDDNSY